jgi:hypothetical protein
MSMSCAVARATRKTRTGPEAFAAGSEDLIRGGE